MISYLIVICLITVSLISIKKYKLFGFILLVALIGSDTDSAGILYAIAAYFPAYKIVIRGITLILFIYSIIYIINMYFKGKIKKNLFWVYFVPLILLSIIVFIVNIVRGVDLITALSEIIWLGIPIFFIWSVGIIKNGDSHSVFTKLIKYQAVVTAIVLLMGPLTAEINGVSYAHLIGEDYWKSLSQTVLNAKISIGQFTKHSLSTLKFAQFHNPNALGLYSTTYLALSLHLLICNKSKRKIGQSILLFIIGLIGWFNSLTRGPIFLAFLVLSFYLFGILIKPKKYSRVFILLIFGMILVLNTGTVLKVLQYLLVNSTSVSFTSRLSGYSFAFEAIASNPLWGVMPTLNDPIPHILPLKIGAYYGIPALILISIPFLHMLIIGSKNFLLDIMNGRSEETVFYMILLGIIYGAILTNGIIVYVLFWVLVAEILKKFGMIGSIKR
ncbi:hypothetical protein [Acetoanaerobium noterae]|uniref:hypothetical protein n=1 Tax=Acetoanaerobium noterae TaxID=745369 RepID=UPI0032219AEC